MTQFLTDDGQIVVGMVQSENSSLIQLVDSQGKSQQLPEARIEDRRLLLKSLMPSNFAELLTDQQLADLLAYLRAM